MKNKNIPPSVSDWMRKMGKKSWEKNKEERTKRLRAMASDAAKKRWEKK